MFVDTKVTVYHENKLRTDALSHNRLKFLNIRLNGLSGRVHPTLQYIVTTDDVLKARVHLKMLAGDYPCNYNLSLLKNSDPHCILCTASEEGSPIDDIVHVLTACIASKFTKQRLLPDLLNAVSLASAPLDLQGLQTDNERLTQFILDPTSPNLPLSTRIAPEHPVLREVLRISRNYCFFINKERVKIQKTLSQ